VSASLSADAQAAYQRECNPSSNATAPSDGDQAADQPAQEQP
jgi:hypothetical protein